MMEYNNVFAIGEIGKDVRKSLKKIGINIHMKV
jgi:hypothetical protein